MLNRKNRWLWTAPAALLWIALSSAPYARAVALADAPAAKAGSPKKLSFEQACFLNWRSGNGLNQEQARQILEPVPGQSFQLTDGPNAENRLAVTWTGMARLRAAWADDSVLRIAFHTTQPFKLYFWGQQGGVVLGCFRNPQNQQHLYWTAMRTVRRPGTPPAGAAAQSSEDAGLAMLAADDQRADRIVAGDYQIRYQAGTLVLTKGDIRMLTVPLETPPRDVYFEGQGVYLRQLAMEHGGPAPDDPIAPPRTILQCDQPAALPWTARPSGPGSFQRLDDGSVELTVKGKTTSSTSVTMPLFRPGLYEVIFQLDTPSPDSGIFLADQQGRAIQGVEFYRDKTPGLVAFRIGKPVESVTASNPNPPQEIPLGFAPQRPWWRLVLGGGTMRCFTGGDGIHWGQALATLPQGGNFMRIGLYCQPGSEPRRIGLRRLIVREIDALMALAPVELEERAEAADVSQRNEELTDVVVWQSQAMGSTPAGVDFAAWRTACAVATLVHGAEPPLAKALLEKLLEDGLSRPMPLAAKLRLLHQATLLWNTWTNEDAQRLVAYWDRVGMALLRDGSLQDLDDFRKARMTASFWTQDYRVEPYSEALARGWLLSLVCRSQWNEAEWFCGQLLFWNQPADGGGCFPTQGQVAALVNWIDPLSDVTGKREPQNGARAEGLLRHPVSVPTSKDAINLATDFRTAVEEKDYRQAFRVVTSATLGGDFSLIPDSADPRRFESLATSIQRLVQSDPQLKQAMNDSLTAMDNLRVSRAIAQGDAPMVRNLSIQYYGTPAGADALRWLGDQMAGAGEFGRAISYFEKALSMASAAQEQQLAARMRLTGAMLGRRLGEPVTVPIQLGDLKIPPADFEKLVAEMLQEHGGDRAKAGGGVIPKSPADDTAPAVAPGPGLYVVQPRMILEGDWGSSPTSVPGCSSLVDWPARQLAVSFEGDAMLLANRFQVAAFDASSGARRWVYGLGAAQGQTHAWPLVPMRPTVFGQRLCARMLGQDGRPGLVCLELASGKMLWNVHYPGEIVSDPLVVQDVLMALTIETQPDQSLTLSLLTLDPDNGKVLGSKPLADINSEWTTQRACQVTVTGNKLLIAVAGALIYCDPFDEILWVRRSARLPAAYDVTWPRQYYQPPLVDRERAYVCQVGTRSVECIDVQSGQLQWEWALLGVQRVLGLAGDRLLVQTDDGILALSAQTGKVLWSHVAANLLDCCPRAQGNTLLCLRTEPLPGAESCPILEWLDLENGQTAGCCMLRGLQVKQSSLGPLVAHNGRLWCFAGVFDAQGTFQPKRKFVELVASEGPLLEPATANLWATQVDPVWPLALERSLPGWTLLSGSYDGRSGLLSPKAGMPEVLITRAAETPAHLSRQLALPAGHPQLAIEMGHAPDGASRLAVRVNGVLYRQWSSQPMKNDNDWQNIQIDLSAMAGRNAWILITQERSGGGAAYAYWKSLEVRLENHP